MENGDARSLSFVLAQMNRNKEYFNRRPNFSRQKFDKFRKGIKTCGVAVIRGTNLTSDTKSSWLSLQGIVCPPPQENSIEDSEVQK
nr:hypothetical transcript [Hymenolepis microstoma]